MPLRRTWRWLWTDGRSNVDPLEGRALLAVLVLAHRLAPRDPLVDNGAETDPRYLSLLKTAPEAP